jgi:excinuclease ABC subunit C
MAAPLFNLYHQSEKMSNIRLKIKQLPDRPGVYLYKDKTGEIIYVGKATSLRRRVASYFMRAGDIKTEKLVADIFDLETRETPTAIEALILESELIKKYKPKYNIKEKDDKSFIYVGITKEEFPKPILIRGHEFASAKSKLLAFFGPFTSSGSLREALKILRGIFPWSECTSPPVGGKTRPCFYYGIKKCPGVCVGKISRADYMKNIRSLILFFEGKRAQVVSGIKKEMALAAKSQDFEKAADLRNRLYSLEHIRDIALIKKDDYEISVENPSVAKGVNGGFYNAMGRIEGYDISNISGTSAVGSMVVFSGGESEKSEYKKFKIRTVNGANDVGMMAEVLTRRFGNDWPHPDILFVDGGLGQVNVALRILKKFNLKIPVVGIAKGLSRKNDRFVFDVRDEELRRAVENFGDLFKRVRDEAHRFAIGYHRKLRGGMLTKKRDASKM